MKKERCARRELGFVEVEWGACADCMDRDRMILRVPEKPPSHPPFDTTHLEENAWLDGAESGMDDPVPQLVHPGHYGKRISARPEPPQVSSPGETSEAPYLPYCTGLAGPGQARRRLKRLVLWRPRRSGAWLATRGTGASHAPLKPGSCLPGRTFPPEAGSTRIEAGPRRSGFHWRS